MGGLLTCNSPGLEQIPATGRGWYVRLQHADGRPRYYGTGKGHSDHCVGNIQLARIDAQALTKTLNVTQRAVHLDREFKCPHDGCPRIFHKQDHLTKHLGTVHVNHVNQPGRYTCRYPPCSVTSNRLTDMTKHVRMVQARRFFPATDHLPFRSSQERCHAGYQPRNSDQR